MKLFLPSEEELNNDFRTSFVFDNNDEMDDFISWLTHMNIEFLKAKIPCIVDGVISQQTCLVIHNSSTAEDKKDCVDDVEPEIVDKDNEETNVEEPIVIKKKKKKLSVESN